MKKLILLVAGVMALAAPLAIAQSGSPPENNTNRSDAAPINSAGVESTGPRLIKFNLDFPGGTPNDLVQAIQKATGRPLNVIIPAEFSQWKLPPLKMNSVDVARLFYTLEQATQSTKAVSLGGGVQYVDTQYGFRHMQGGPPTDETVWYFSVKGSMSLPKVSRFYYLAPYLDGGLTVDDVTTAIQTGWRLLGIAPTPELSFHRETKLLIAAGDLANLEVIDQVLKALDAVKVKSLLGTPDAQSKTKP